MSTSSAQIKFIQSCTPPLDAGEYRITVTQEVNIDSKDIPSKDLPSAATCFSVKGPRFSINPGDIHSLFPCNNHEGEFDNCLPHIVLNRKTLPWERTIDGTLPKRVDNNDESSTILPWLALILFSEDEVPKLQTMTLKELLNLSANTAGPELKLETTTGESESDRCACIDLDYDLFQ